MFKVAVAGGPVAASPKTVDRHAAVRAFDRNCFEKTETIFRRRQLFSGRKYLLAVRAERPDWQQVTEKAAVIQTTEPHNRIFAANCLCFKKKKKLHRQHMATRGVSTFFLQNLFSRVRIWRKVSLLAASAMDPAAPAAGDPCDTYGLLSVVADPAPSAAAARRLSANVATLDHPAPLS